MSSDGVLQALDGVAVLARGDVVLVLYQLPARLHRTRWLFDRIDEILVDRAGGIAVLMVVLPTADPPDGPTRAENNARMQRVRARLRRLVTTPVGDAFRMSVVRAVMRGLAMLQGQTRTHVIADTVEGGVMRLLEVKTGQTPGRARILIDLRAMHAALGADARYLEPARALSGSG